ncbi:MAG: hypothetical protein JO228_05380, partial [Xanthobacteraceae bacterium]|nr:hypothetical protein [Xanthobacteraceae bacterium]
MSQAVPLVEAGSDLPGLLQDARSASDALLAEATYKVRERVTTHGRLNADAVEREQ